MSVKVKICGISNVGDALAAAKCGADFIGLNFYPGSPRCVSRGQAQLILQALPANVTPVALFVNDKKVGEGRVDKTEPVRFSANETFDTGLDSASPVSTEYKPPFRYTSTLKKVDIDVVPAQLGANDLQKLRALALMARLGVE